MNWRLRSTIFRRHVSKRDVRKGVYPKPPKLTVLQPFCAPQSAEGCPQKEEHFRGEKSQVHPEIFQAPHLLLPLQGLHMVSQHFVFFCIKGTLSRECNQSAAQVSKYILNKVQSKEGLSLAISRKDSDVLDLKYYKQSLLFVSGLY
jgi:hypothetical protein